MKLYKHAGKHAFPQMLRNNTLKKRDGIPSRKEHAVNLSRFEDLAGNRLVQLYLNGELGYHRGLIVDSAVYAEMQAVSEQRCPTVRVTFTRGTCEVSYRFYVLCSDYIPKPHTFLITPQTKERYELYYLGKEEGFFHKTAPQRMLSVPDIQLQILEKNPITGTVIIASAGGSFVFKHVTFDQILELAKSVAPVEPYWVNTDFVSLMKTIDLDNPSTSTYTLDGSRFKVNEENYRLYFTSLIREAHERLRPEGARLNLPSIRWNDDPDEYDYHSAWVMGGGSLEYAVGKLFMHSDSTHSPRTYFIVGVYKDGWGKVDTYTIPLYDNVDTPVFYTVDPEEFLRQASIHFHPDEVASYIASVGSRVPFRLVKQLRQEYPHEPIMPVEDDDAGRPYPLTFGNGGEVSVRFLTTRGTPTRWYTIGSSSTHEWWTKLRKRFFPEQWSSHPVQAPSDPLDGISYE